MNRETKQLTFLHTDLASRASGAEYRRLALAAIEHGVKVEFDFSPVVSVSESFADELFGVLAVQIGIDTLKAFIRTKGASEDVLASIVGGIQLRLNAEDGRAA